jgi:hypothetical protein
MPPKVTQVWGPQTVELVKRVERFQSRATKYTLNVPFICDTHGRTGRKKLGGRKEICPTFSDCARVVKKKFPEKLSEIVVDGGGGE